MPSPTKRQAALAARQLHYHRRKLRWIEDRMRDNEALLLSYLTCAGTGAAVLPGGYRVLGGRTLPYENVAVERLVPKNPYEQLVLRTDDPEGGFQEPCNMMEGRPTPSASAGGAWADGSTSADRLC